MEYRVNGTEITEKINDETAITVSPRWLMEIILSIRRDKGLNPGGNKLTGVRIRVTKIENSREVEVNRFGKR